MRRGSHTNGLLLRALNNYMERIINSETPLGSGFRKTGDCWHFQGEIRAFYDQRGSDFQRKWGREGEKVKGGKGGGQSQSVFFSPVLEAW